MRTSKEFKFLPIVTLCIAAYAAPLLAAAQQPTDNAAPPQLQKLEEGEAPAITIRGSATDRNITQKREQGKVTSVKVKSGKSTYYVKPNTPAGSALPGDVQSDATRPAQWQVLEFDWNRAPNAKEEAQAAAVPPPPAIAAPSPAKNK